MSVPDFDPGEWEFLAPLTEADLPTAPPPEREVTGGISFGSDLVSVRFAETTDSATDLGRAVCEDWASAHPGLAEISRLGSTDFAAIDAVQRIDALLAFERQLAWSEARKQELLALISTRDWTEEHWCIEEVGCALGLSAAATRTTLAHAEQLVHHLPATLTALSEGTLSSAQANVITKASFELPDELLPEFEQRVLARAETQSLTNLTRTAQRAAHRLDPASMAEKARRAISERHVRISPAGPGTAWLMALLPAADAHTIQSRLDAAARTAGPEDPRTLDQLRADTLTSGLLTGLPDAGLPTEQGRRPGINVTISLDTLLGKDDHPGWLDNYGPLSADYTREIAHDPTGTWRRLITDPLTGQLLDYGTTRYRPPQHLTEHIITRDGECTFPYCTHPAQRSDLDHITPYPHGPTAASNLQPLHRRHHNAKTQAGWHPQRDPVTGETHWTSPQGRKYQSKPPQRWTTPPPDNEPQTPTGDEPPLGPPQTPPDNEPPPL